MLVSILFIYMLSLVCSTVALNLFTETMALFDDDTKPFEYIFFASISIVMVLCIVFSSVMIVATIIDIILSLI